MNREKIHRGILRCLLSLRGRSVERVRLVSRFYNAELLGGDSVTHTFLFIPDLHLLSQRGEQRFRYGFQRLKKNRYVKRSVLLDQVCEKIVEYRTKTGLSLKTVQLGDIIDLWRETKRREKDVKPFVGRILDENPEVRRRLVRPGPKSLRPDILLGNHDLRMNQSKELARARWAIPYRIGSKKSLLVTHGHLFDTVETGIPNRLKEWGVDRLGPSVSAQKYTLDRTKERKRHGMIGPHGSPPIVLGDKALRERLPPCVNVWRTVAPCPEELLIRNHELLPLALDFAKGLRKGTEKYLRWSRLESRLPHLRAMVIGHSHRARICVHQDREKPENGLVLVDCGGWIEFSRFGETTVPSCQIGVLCGGDMRIYQLDPHRSLFQ